MFERFTDRARRVVVLAQEEARMLNHNYIGTEHLLLGLIHEGEGIGARALESLGVTLNAVREQVQDIVGPGPQAPNGHIPFTPRAKKVLELSLREGLQMGHKYIGTEFLLLGLIREGDGVAAQVLAVGGCTALAYSCWEHGIQRGNLAVLAAGSYFTPVLSALWASVWLAVRPGLPFWQGVVLVTLGSLVCWGATRGR